MDFGFDVNVGTAIGIGGTGFGSQQAQEAIGGLVDAAQGEDAPNRDPFMGIPAPTLPEERSLLERAAGWASDKVQAKIENMVNNPVTTAINIAFGAVPVAGAINSLSGAFGGPTIGGLATAIGRGIASGDIQPGIADDVSSALGNIETNPRDANPKVIRYFRYRDGRIESRVVDNSTPALDNASTEVSAEEANYSRG